MIGQSAPTDEVVRFAQQITRLESRVSELERKASAGLVLSSPDGTRWRVSVTNAGVLQATAI